MLSKAKLKKYEEILRKRLNELLNEADQAVKEITQGGGERYSDPTDRAVEELDQHRMLRFKERERKLIAKIERALERIQNKTYGVCLNCEAPIAEERLKARPMTELCIDCATEVEGESGLRRRQDPPTQSPNP